MDYQKKAVENLEKIQGLLKDYQKQLQESDVDLQAKIREMPDGEEKAQMNDYRNKIMEALRNRDQEAVKAIIKQVQNR